VDAHLIRGAILLLFVRPEMTITNPASQSSATRIPLRRRSFPIAARPLWIRQLRRSSGNTIGSPTAWETPPSSELNLCRWLLSHGLGLRGGMLCARWHGAGSGAVGTVRQHAS
jgi:hypothetical protein